MGVEVRRARAEDVEVLVALQREVHGLHVASRPDFFKPTDDAAVAAWFRGLIESADAQIWVAVEADVVLGNAVAMQQQRSESMFSAAHTRYELDQIVVTRDHRRKGIARALLKAVVDHAHSRGIHEIELSSWSFNTDAHAAFERLGFVPKLVRFELRSR
jgi:GNAT superfamily N-acetyltransferase